jgi:trans-aconitate 2-methyltransferase
MSLPLVWRQKVRRTVPNSPFAAVSFYAKPEVNSSLIECALPLIADRPNARVLDLGCGSGALAIAVALARRDINVIALDISPANVAKATEAASAAGVGDRVKAICGDYLTIPQQKYDLILSDSVLYILAGGDRSLAARLFGDLTHKGLVVAITPIESTSNRLRVMFRRFWRIMPRAADRIVLALAKMVYPKVPIEVLADRIPYLRVLPVRLYGPAMKAAFERENLEVFHVASWPNESVAKLTHALVVWRQRTCEVPIHD